MPQGRRRWTEDHKPMGGWMAKSAEELRAEAAEKSAKAAREKELANRKARKDAQAKVQAGAYRPLVTT